MEEKRDTHVKWWSLLTCIQSRIRFLMHKEPQFLGIEFMPGRRAVCPKHMQSPFRNWRSIGTPHEHVELPGIIVWNLGWGCGGSFMFRHPASRWISSVHCESGDLRCTRRLRRRDNNSSVVATACSAVVASRMRSSSHFAPRSSSSSNDSSKRSCCCCLMWPTYSSSSSMHAPSSSQYSSSPVEWRHKPWRIDHVVHRAALGICTHFLGIFFVEIGGSRRGSSGRLQRVNIGGSEVGLPMMLRAPPCGQHHHAVELVLVEARVSRSRVPGGL